MSFYVFANIDILCWVPSHIGGIRDNEKADSALDLPRVKADFKHHINK